MYISWSDFLYEKSLNIWNRDGTKFTRQNSYKPGTNETLIHSYMQSRERDSRKRQALQVIKWMKMCEYNRMRVSERSIDYCGWERVRCESMRVPYNMRGTIYTGKRTPMMFSIFCGRPHVERLRNRARSRGWKAKALLFVCSTSLMNHDEGSMNCMELFTFKFCNAFG